MFYIKKNGVLKKISGRIQNLMASAIGFTPPTGMSATNVQGAIVEVANDLNNLDGLEPLGTGNITASTELAYVKALLDWCYTNVPTGKLSAITSTWSGQDFGAGTVFRTSSGTVYLTLSFGSQYIYRCCRTGTTSPGYSCYKIQGTLMS